MKSHGLIWESSDKEYEELESVLDLSFNEVCNKYKSIPANENLSD